MLTEKQNPFRYRVYVVRYDEKGNEKSKTFVAGKRVHSEAVLARDAQSSAMSHTTTPDGGTLQVEVRDEPYPEWPKD